MHEENIYFQIVSNLKERVHGVNLAVALSGVDDWAEGIAALEELICQRQVLKTIIRTETGQELPLYLYNHERTEIADERRQQFRTVT